MREKVDPYLRPLYDALYDLLDLKKSKNVLKLVYRNSTFGIYARQNIKNSFAILDEAQNATDTQIKTSF